MATNLTSALLAAQSQFPAIPKDKENPHFKSRYSSLDAIQSACWPVLHKHNILPQFKTDTADGRLTVTFTLTHTESGEVASNAITVEAGTTVQAIGSQITYLRRYTAAPALGICSDEDDDGNLATAAKKPQPRQQPAKPQPTLPAPPRLTADTDLAAWERHDAAAYVAHAKTSQQLLELLNRLATTPEWASNMDDWPWVCKLITDAYRMIVASNPNQKNDEFVFQMKGHAEAIREMATDPFTHPAGGQEHEPVPQSSETADV